MLGKPVTSLGAALDKSPLAKLIAKAFLLGYGAQIVFVLGPINSDPGLIIRSLADPVFLYSLVNGACGKGMVAAWAIRMTDPYDDTPTPEVPAPQTQEQPQTS